jgi:hypothetical protein
MKTQFIQIQDIAEIDTTKITVYDLNKRFIDRAGNMYGLRYNRDMKCVEIIKIMRTNARNQSYFHQKMIQNKKNPLEQSNGTEQDPNQMDDSTFDSDYADGDDTYSGGTIFDADRFTREIFNVVSNHKERIAGIIKNISNARLVSREQRELTIRLDDILRNLDIDGVQRIDKIVNAYREMTEYPRSLNYYIGRLDTRARTIAAEILSEDKKLRYVLLHELEMLIKDLILVLSNNLNNLKEFITELKDTRVTRLNATEKQSLNDATTSIDNTLYETRNLSDRLRLLDEFLSYSKNFS